MAHKRKHRRTSKRKAILNALGQLGWHARGEPQDRKLFDLLGEHRKLAHGVLGRVGSSGVTDSGVTARLFGTFLTWLNDRTSDSCLGPGDEREHRLEPGTALVPELAGRLPCLSP